MPFKIALGLVVALGLMVNYHLAQLYTQDSPTTASNGIYFTKTLNLEAYKMISSGKDFRLPLKGPYNNYSRSDRHNEVVTVYCNKYCK